MKLASTREILPLHLVFWLAAFILLIITPLSTAIADTCPNTTTLWINDVDYQYEDVYLFEMQIFPELSGDPKIIVFDVCPYSSPVHTLTTECPLAAPTPVLELRKCTPMCAKSLDKALTTPTNDQNIHTATRTSFFPVTYTFEEGASDKRMEKSYSPLTRAAVLRAEELFSQGIVDLSEQLEDESWSSGELADYAGYHGFLDALDDPGLADVLSYPSYQEYL